MTKVLIWLASGDLDKLRPGILWGTNAMGYGWVDEVRFVVFGEAERRLPEDDELFTQVLEAQGTVFCKAVADGMEITDRLEGKGATVQFVGAPIAQAMKEGWQVLVF
jgi:hypothetical protein